MNIENAKKNSESRSSQLSHVDSDTPQPHLESSNHKDQETKDDGQNHKTKKERIDNIYRRILITAENFSLTFIILFAFVEPTTHPAVKYIDKNDPTLNKIITSLVLTILIQFIIGVYTSKKYKNKEEHYVQFLGLRPPRILKEFGVFIANLLDASPPTKGNEEITRYSRTTEKKESPENADSIRVVFTDRPSHPERKQEEIDFHYLVRSLERERATASSRSFLNLIIGTIIALFGVTILYRLISEVDYNNASWHIPFLQIVSRISIAAVVELFAYFFLVLYRSGLQDIKYFRNELSNIISYKIAYDTAILKGDKKTISDLILKLSNTERNFILKKGESTIGLDQNRLDRTEDNRMIEAVTSAVKNATKASRATKSTAKE